MKLSKYEQETLDFLENQDWEGIPNLKDEKKRIQAIAKNQLKKDKRINIRLISSVLHKYVTGQLKPTTD